MEGRIFLYPYAGPGGRNYLKQIGTLRDIELNSIELKEGIRLPFYCDDADDHGPNDLIFEGTMHYDDAEKRWYTIIDESSYGHVNDGKDVVR
jgi:hypothetical protein